MYILNLCQIKCKVSNICKEQNKYKNVQLKENKTEKAFSPSCRTRLVPKILSNSI